MNYLIEVTDIISDEVKDQFVISQNDMDLIISLGSGFFPVIPGQSWWLIDKSLYTYLKEQGERVLDHNGCLLWERTVVGHPPIYDSILMGE